MANEQITQDLEFEERIALERLDATYFAIPEHDHKHFELTQAVYDGLLAEKVELMDRLAKLQAAFNLATSSHVKRKEQAIGFFFGFIASLLVTILWWQLTTHFPFFR